MRASRIQLVALLIVALTLGVAQCMATCAAEGCGPAVPPCHQQHHGTSRICAQDFQLPDVHVSPLIHIAAVSVIVPAEQDACSFRVAQIPPAFSLSPPNPSLSTSSILRI